MGWAVGLTVGPGVGVGGTGGPGSPPVASLPPVGSTRSLPGA